MPIPGTVPYRYGTIWYGTGTGTVRYGTVSYCIVPVQVRYRTVAVYRNCDTIHNAYVMYYCGINVLYGTVWYGTVPLRHKGKLEKIVRYLKYYVREVCRNLVSRNRVSKYLYG